MGSQDVGFLYGYGVFETIRIAHAAPIFLTEHLHRLTQAADFCRIFCPPFESLSKDVMRAIEQKNIQNGVLNLILTAGDRSAFLDNPDSHRVVIQVRPLERPIQPVSLSFIPDPFPRSPLDQFKTLTYFRYAYIRRQLKQGQDGVFFNAHQEVLEATSSNVFFVKNGQILTPPLGFILPGIVRQFVMNRFDVREQRILLHQAEAADEVFLTNSVAGILPCQYSGPVTQQVAKAYQDEILAV